jgi:uncharacterized FlaG/YvyC family protein
MIRMEPIKPIEGVLEDSQGQGSVLAEVVRDHYWRQHSQEVPAVEAGEDSSRITERQQGRPEEKGIPAKPRRTYAEFEVNRDTREVTVRIIDADSGKLVRTIPPEELAREIAKGNFDPKQLRRRAVLI